MIHHPLISCLAVWSFDRLVVWSFGARCGAPSVVPVVITTNCVRCARCAPSIVPVVPPNCVRCAHPLRPFKARSGLTRRFVFVLYLSVAIWAQAFLSSLGLWLQPGSQPDDELLSFGHALIKTDYWPGSRTRCPITRPGAQGPGRAASN